MPADLCQRGGAQSLRTTSMRSATAVHGEGRHQAGRLCAESSLTSNTLFRPSEMRVPIGEVVARRSTGCRSRSRGSARDASGSSTLRYCSSNPVEMRVLNVGTSMTQPGESLIEARVAGEAVERGLPGVGELRAATVADAALHAHFVCDRCHVAEGVSGPLPSSKRVRTLMAYSREHDAAARDEADLARGCPRPMLSVRASVSLSPVSGIVTCWR